MSHKKTFQPLLSPVVELLREYSLTFEEKKKVDEAIKELKAEIEVLKGQNK